MTDEELMTATVHELIARRHCLKTGVPFDRDWWLGVRAGVERILDAMSASNAKAHAAVADRNHGG